MVFYTSRSLGDSLHSSSAGRRIPFPSWLSSHLILTLEALEIAENQEELNWFLKSRGF